MQIKTKIVSCHTADSKPVKQEVNGTVILPPLVFIALIYWSTQPAALLQLCLINFCQMFLAHWYKTHLIIPLLRVLVLPLLAQGDDRAKMLVFIHKIMIEKKQLN